MDWFYRSLSKTSFEALCVEISQRQTCSSGRETVLINPFWQMYISDFPGNLIIVTFDRINFLLLTVAYIFANDWVITVCFVIM